MAKLTDAKRGGAFLVTHYRPMMQASARPVARPLKRSQRLAI
jgi:hypothetical protein